MKLKKYEDYKSEEKNELLSIYDPPMNHYNTNSSVLNRKILTVSSDFRGYFYILIQ